jgi:hypothetical protein
MKTKGRRNIVHGLRREGRKEPERKQRRREKPRILRPEYLLRRNCGTHLNDWADKKRTNPRATLREREDWVNLTLAASPAHSRAIRMKIFRQDFFVSLPKIKFRFLLVASNNGF